MCHIGKLFQTHGNVPHLNFRAMNGCSQVLWFEYFFPSPQLPPQNSHMNDLLKSS